MTTKSIPYSLFINKYMIKFIDIFHIVELSYLILFATLTPKPPIPIAIGRGCKDVVSEICFNHRNFLFPLLSPHLGVWGSGIKNTFLTLS